VLASGADFPDALASSVAAHRLGGTLLLVDPAVLGSSSATRRSLAASRRVTDSVLVAGGLAAVADSVLDSVVATTDDAAG